MNFKVKYSLWILIIFVFGFFLSGCSEVYSVNFETNGGTELESLEIAGGNTLAEPEVPQKDGYVFSGWFSDSGLSSGYDFSQPVNDDLNLYAKWDSATYTITYNLDGGTNGDNPTTYTMDTQTITLAESSKDDRLFEGWYDNQGFNGEPLTQIETGSTGDIELYAKWSANLSTITFDSRGGSIVESISQDYETPLTTPEDPSKEGYTFYGWYSDETLDNAYTFTTMPAEDLTLYARWEIATYTISYNLYGGINGSNPTSYTMETESLLLSEPTREAHTFEGWYDNPDRLGSPLTHIESGTTGTINLHAKWTINQYPITYHTFDTHDPLNTVQLEAGEAITNLFIGGFHSAAVTSQGRMFTWGSNSSGRLGDGTTTHRDIPTDITAHFGLDGGEGIISTALGSYHSSALTSEGRVFTWGSNYYGQLGDGTTTNRVVPTDITAHFGLEEGETVISMSLGRNHSQALTSEGRIFTWGENWYGQLGDGSTTDSYTPIDITHQFGLAPDETLSVIALGYYHSSALTSQGRMFTWGENWEGQLGDDTDIDKPVPTDITYQFGLESGETIIGISMGHYHSSAVTSQGRMFTWGDNWEGQLGDGTTTNKYIPEDITDQFDLQTEESLSSISLGAYYTSAITDEGRIFTWGANNKGQLGDGTYSNVDTPKEITSHLGLPMNESVSGIYSGSFHAAVLTDQGRVFTWGNNEDGQLGNSMTINQSTPQSILGTAYYSIETLPYDYGTSVDFYRPDREGYEIEEWYNDKDLTDEYTFTTMPSEELSLYAKWSLITYDISYNLDGGVNGSNRETYTIETETFFLSEPTKEGYTFNGWYDNSEFTGNALTQIPIGTSGDITLYAKWTVI